ncbi:MAG: hypothetical protein P8O78_01150 [Flavobacteriaceae bacterium]|nr:hypothetical protein [Flavobacteriaceae bacterium]
MSNQQMFLIGSIVFFTYLFFYMRIVIRDFGKNNKTENNFVDSNDFDGIGNQGRIPNKNPKNRAI